MVSTTLGSHDVDQVAERVRGEVGAEGSQMYDSQTCNNQLLFI